jgi:hypothetical protein
MTTMTWQQAIVGLYLLNDYRRAANNGGAPAPEWFQRHGVLIGLSTPTTRRAALRLARLQFCIGCGENVAVDSEGDHIIPVSRGGPAGLENYIPMCRSCNASKGNRDLFEWWLDKERSFAAMHPDAVTAYCRLMLPRLSYERTLHKPAPPALMAALGQLAASLPDEHRRALWSRIQWVVGRST